MHNLCSFLQNNIHNSTFCFHFLKDETFAIIELDEVKHNAHQFRVSFHFSGLCRENLERQVRANYYET